MFIKSYYYAKYIMVLLHSVLTTILWNSYYFLHFTDEQIET